MWPTQPIEVERNILQILDLRPCESLLDLRGEIGRLRRRDNERGCEYPGSTWCHLQICSMMSYGLAIRVSPTISVQKLTVILIAWASPNPAPSYCGVPSRNPIFAVCPPRKPLFGWVVSLNVTKSVFTKTKCRLDTSMLICFSNRLMFNVW